MRKVLQAGNTTITTNANALPTHAETGVKKVLAETYPPSPIAFQDFVWITKHSGSMAEATEVYQQYLKAIALG